MHLKRWKEDWTQPAALLLLQKDGGKGYLPPTLLCPPEVSVTKARLKDYQGIAVPQEYSSLNGVNNTSLEPVTWRYGA